MGSLINLSRYRHQRKSTYLKAYEHQLEKFFEGFLTRHFKESFSILSAQYMACKVHQNEMAWDYDDFRDALKDAIAIVYGGAIWGEITQQRWFDKRFISQEEIIERCTTYFILQDTRVANQ